MPESIDFEWRTFDNVRQGTIDGILALEKFEEKSLTDRYVMCGQDNINIKLLPSGIKIKELLEKRNGIEKWLSYYLSFPVDVKDFSEKAKLTVACEKQSIVYDDLIERILDKIVEIEKIRFMRIFRPSPSGIIGVDVNYIRMFHREFASVGIEGKSQDMVSDALEKLGLKRYSPKNYAEFLRGEIK